MPKRPAGLDVLKVKNLPPGRYGDGDGLYLFVRTPESAYWVYRYTRAGRMREMGLGRARGRNAVTLAQARGEAGELFRKVRAGVDPLAEREAKEEAAKAEAQEETRRAVTFQEVAEKYIADNGPAWRNAKHRGQWMATLATYVYPLIGALPVANITAEHVLNVLRPIWHTKPESASRIRGRVESILDAARVNGFRTGDNPARWQGNLAKMLPPRSKVAAIEHHAALPYDDMPAFFLRLQAADGISARALEFTILTAARTGEALGATWAEIDMDKATWNVPASRMKARKLHIVALSTEALALLRKMETLRDGPYVFPGLNPKKPLSNMALLMVLRRMKRGDLTAHGFRSTFRDWAAEKTDFASEVIEKALAHAIPSKVEAAYRRGDLLEKRIPLMEAWGQYCTTPAKPEARKSKATGGVTA